MRNYLVIFDINGATVERLAILVPLLSEILRTLTRESPELAFRSVRRDCFGYFLQSTLVAGQMRAMIESPKSGPVLEGADKFMILELGADFDQLGLSRSTTWLQRHPIPR